MQKLYPQVLRAEQSIQQLRGELQDAETRGRSQRGQLTEADRQIRDLYAKLGLAERKRRDLHHEYDFVTHEAEDSFQRGREAEQECEELTEMLNSSEQFIGTGLQMLSTRTCLQEQEREQIGLAAQDLVERRRQILAERSLTQGLRTELERTLREGRGFASELACAAQLDVLRQQRLEEADRERERQRSRFRDADQACRELRRQVATLEKDSRQTGSKLAMAELADRQNEKLRGELAERTEEMHSLEARWDAADEGSREELESTVESETRAKEVQVEIVAAEETVQTRRADMDRVEDWWRVTEVKLSTTRREHNALRHSLTRAEHDGEQTEQHMEQKLQDLYSRDGRLRGSVSELEEEMVRAELQEEETSEENIRIQRRIESMQTESSALNRRKTEVLQAVEEMRNKPSCSVS